MGLRNCQERSTQSEFPAMSVLPHSATFHERVQDCFVMYRRSGVSLSPADLELLDAWAARNVPFEVVARGIRKAADAALWDAAEGQGHLRSLKAAKKHVDAEVAKFERHAAGRTTVEELPDSGEPFHVVRHRKLVSSLRKLTGETPPRWLQHLTIPNSFEAADRQETVVLFLFFRRLPWPHRSALLRQARTLMENTPAASSSGRRESLRFHRAALVRQACALPTFW
jgi:hypothetical protein